MKFDGGAGQLPERIADNLGIGSKLLLRMRHSYISIPIELQIHTGM